MAEAAVGAFAHERNENLDEYLKAIGVPYMGRKMMGMARPRLEVENNGENWTIRSLTTVRNSESTFVLGAEYEESMPSGDVIKNVTTFEGDGLVTRSTSPNGSKLVRSYNFTPEGVVLTMTHEESGQTAKRFFKRVVAK